MPAAEAGPISTAEAAALFAGLENAEALVLAVSGGPDSTALLLLAARWRAGLSQPPRTVAVTVDHALRPESAREARAVRRLAATLGVAHRTVRWTARKPRSGLQEAARLARYRLLANVARAVGAAAILTAHTQDDQAETVLFRLARGSGIAGLAGMAREAPVPASGWLGRELPHHDTNHSAPAVADVVVVRPFLTVPKQRLIATLLAEGLPFVEDPSNADPRYTRARLRSLMPTLAREGLDAARLALFAERMRRAQEALEATAARVAAEVVASSAERTKLRCNAQEWARQPSEIRLRLLGRAIAAVGDEGPVELGKLEQLEAAFAAAAAGCGGAARTRRTLAGAMITLAGDALTVERAPPRRRSALRPRAKAGEAEGTDEFTPE